MCLYLYMYFRTFENFVGEDSCDEYMGATIIDLSIKRERQRKRTKREL